MIGLDSRGLPDKGWLEVPWAVALALLGLARAALLGPWPWLVRLVATGPSEQQSSRMREAQTPTKMQGLVL